MKLSTQTVRRIATDAAHSVCAAGSVGGDAHNIGVIERAITTALNTKPKKRRK